MHYLINYYFVSTDIRVTALISGEMKDGIKNISD
jgi:hypothetical protein